MVAPPDLVARLNRIVGQHLPKGPAPASVHFIGLDRLDTLDRIPEVLLLCRQIWFGTPTTNRAVAVNA